ncbi:MAG: pilus assembly protein N-terminal domain-containing protein [Myxococcales bacterium]
MALALLSALVLCAAPAHTPAPAGPPKDETTFKLKLHEEKVIKVPGLSRIAIGDPEVADVRPKGATEIAMRGLVEGRTELLVWTSSGTRLHYPIVVGNPKTAPANAQTKSLDAVVSGGSAGVIEDVALTLSVGEEKSLSYSDVSKVAVTQDAPTVQVSPLDSGDGVRVKGLAVGTAKAVLHIGGRPAVRLAVTVLDSAAKAGSGAGSDTAKPVFGGRALPKPDCNGDASSTESSRKVAEAVDLERAKKLAPAIDKLLAVLEQEPSAAYVHRKLGALYARSGQQEKAAAAYETFALSCPADPQTAKVRALLAELRKSLAK